MTWRRGLALLAAVVVIAATRGLWTGWIGESLVCAGAPAAGDAILIENFVPNYLLFERAGELQRAGLASRVIVPIQVFPGAETLNAVSRDIAFAMARHAGLGAWDAVPIVTGEPITLSAARQLRDRLTAEGIRAIIVVSPGFRSRRSALVYQTVFGRGGMRVSCVPVFGQATPARWTRTWHGIQAVTQEFLKLQYYRLYVMPVLARRDP
jgi:hypothetical protein